MSGEIDFDRDAELDKQEQEDDQNATVRELIIDQFPALAVILTP